VEAAANEAVARKWIKLYRGPTDDRGALQAR